MFVCSYMPNLTCLAPCGMCASLPEHQDECGCLPQPTKGIVERQVVLAWRLRHDLPRLRNQAYYACEAAAAHLLTFAHKKMSVEAKLVFWDMVSNHVPN